MITARPPWKTVLLDGETLLRELLAHRLSLDRRFELAGQAEDGPAGQALCLRTMPDLVVMDVELPGTDGIGLARFLARHLPATRVLALTRSDEGIPLSCLRGLGVRGFVEKTQSLEVLEEALVEVASGGTYLTARLRQALENSGSCPLPPGLSTREQEVLQSVVRGLTSQAIARRLGLSPRSVETYRYRLRKKLNVGSLAGLVEYAFRHGLAPSRNTATCAPASRHS
jgi:DNA-binding NarL/FixJ family response regulator